MVSRESRSKWTQLHNGLNSFYHSLMCSFTQMTSIRKCLGRGCRKGDMTLIFPLNAKIPMSFPGTVDYVYIESCFYLPFSKKKKIFSHCQRLWSPRKTLLYLLIPDKFCIITGIILHEFPNNLSLFRVHKGLSFTKNENV